MKKIDYYGNKNIIFQKLKAARTKAGLSQLELAAKMQIWNINIDQQIVSKIERNLRMVTDYELMCFCEILNVDVRWMLKDIDRMGGK